jgi:5-methylthioadenosine/S-adenosylhomocysteine deaminase
MPERTLIKGGTIISMDGEVGDLRRGDVLIEDEVIAAVGASLEVADCRTIDAEGMVVLPGLVDSHRHLWYTGVRGWGMDSVMDELINGLWPKLAAHYSPEDLYACNRAAIAEALDQGITTVFDWCHLINSAAHADEALRAHLELPGRAVFAVGGSMTRKLAEFAGETEHEDSWAPARTIREGPLASHPRLSMALAVQGLETTTMEITAADIAVARELEIPISMHIDIQSGKPPGHAIARLREAGLLDADMQFVHCCTTPDEEFRMLAEAGGRVAVSPMAEVSIGYGTPPLARMREAGLKPSVGADAVCVASGDQFDEARTGLFAQRIVGMQRRTRDGVVDDLGQLGMTTREALETITINAAQSCWLEDRVGSLTPGKLADVILLRGTDLNLAPLSNVVGTVVGCAHGGNVDTVLVGGRVVKSGGALVGIDRDEIVAELAAARDRIFAFEDPEGIIP